LFPDNAFYQLLDVCGVAMLTNFVSHSIRIFFLFFYPAFAQDWANLFFRGQLAQ
jgi:hypothetical protein